MIVRFGYVAMSTVVKNASPSKTMTATTFITIPDRAAAIRKLERIATENLHHTLRLLRHNRAHDIHLYRFSSKLIPLLGHELLDRWDPFPNLADSFAEVGAYIREHKMRVSFHPDHYTVLNTPHQDVLGKSYADLDRHVRMLEGMGLDETAKCNIHMGGAYKDKNQSSIRFISQFKSMSNRIRSHITIENDDKTFNALETLHVCEQLHVPMVLDIHHHAVNNSGDDASTLWPRICRTWEDQSIPPKIHVSSPKSEQDPRSHADYIHTPDLSQFLRLIADQTPELDVMIEAKMKDDALFRLIEELKHEAGVELVDDATIKINTTIND
ncbi:MAG: UV DNA damage repair endonuclease UvsE [Paenibacillaceae bacterium]